MNIGRMHNNDREKSPKRQSKIDSVINTTLMTISLMRLFPVMNEGNKKQLL
ncbi:hypothetical protein NJ959_18690 [Symplocastrum sp. BBK-W-15]|uniref:Uncharacterized protein n=1 Tax=Limnofasciculus baicalensis BBK-W-15 TaxID=2699891 RepID=A0AAE3GVB7_9CYAN|nr:hypothetical protein [Limnofasciculus baicalensis BBK-W-15]